jgi:hypothetical protein
MLQPGQDAARHPSERGITSFVRRQQAPEGIDIMAGDNGALRRQFVNEMRVTVINDVKQIEPALDTPQFPWVMDETSEDASERMWLGIF